MSILTIIRFEAEIIPKLELMLEMERAHLKYLETKKLHHNNKTIKIFRFKCDYYIELSRINVRKLELQIESYKKFIKELI